MKILDALAWAGQFTRALRNALRLWKAVQARDGLSPGEREQVEFILRWLWMVQHDRLDYQLCGDSRDLLDDYRFWKDRDGPLVPETSAGLLTAQQKRATERRCPACQVGTLRIVALLSAADLLILSTRALPV